VTTRARSGISGHLVGVRLPFTTTQRVRCLVCGEEYSKPRGPGTIDANPGCPICEYVGWEPLRWFAAFERPRSAADRQLLRSA
jgi:hypothetical protein